MTEATKPQVIVKVDGVPAACRNLDCDYLYQETKATITGISKVVRNDGSVRIKLTGTDMPRSEDIVEISIGGVACELKRATSRELVCEPKDGQYVAGSYSTVQVIDKNGRVAVNLADNATPVTFPLEVRLNSSRVAKSGGQLLTFTG